MKLIKRLFKLACLLLILVVAGDVYVFVRGMDSIVNFKSNLQHAECAIVLGAGVNADGTPGKFLQNRLDTAIELYNDGLVDKLLLTGDNGQVEYNEVGAMRDYALEKGVPSEDIFMDYAGFSTYESMYRAKAIFQVETAIVVTQRYHEFRSLYIAQKQGIQVQGYCADAVHNDGDKFRIIREMLAMDKDIIQCFLKTRPTYLGEEIPISGDGTASWA